MLDRSVCSEGNAQKVVNECFGSDFRPFCLVSGCNLSSVSMNAWVQRVFIEKTRIIFKHLDTTRSVYNC